MIKTEVTKLKWQRDDEGWTLRCGRRRMGRVVQDGKMYRRELPSSRLSDIANLSWTKDAVTAEAVRELQCGTAEMPARL